MTKKKTVAMAGAIVGASALLMAAVTIPLAGAEVSLLDRIAEVTGTRLADKILAQVTGTQPAVDITGDEPIFGAQSGPDSFFPAECHQGICDGYVSAALTPTSTICSLQEPFGATSTLEKWSGNVTANNMGEALGPG